jgi:hypothetical protein
MIDIENVPEDVPEESTPTLIQYAPVNFHSALSATTLITQATSQNSSYSESIVTDLSCEFTLEINNEEIVLNTNEASCSIDDFNENFNMTLNPQEQNDCIIPPGLLYFNSNLTQIVFERPPQIVEIKVYPHKKEQAHSLLLNDKDSSFRTYKLPLPWQIYIAEFSESNTLETLQIYFSTSEISSVERGSDSLVLINRHNKSLMRATLPNLYKDHKVCLDLSVQSVGDNSLESKINTAYLAFWQTNFNYDLLDNLMFLKDHHSSHQGSSNDSYHNVLSHWESVGFGEVLDFHHSFFPYFNNRMMKSSLGKVVENRVPLYSKSSFGDKMNSFMSKLPVIV